jgi:hypothetical protein
MEAEYTIEDEEQEEEQPEEIQEEQPQPVDVEVLQEPQPEEYHEPEYQELESEQSQPDPVDVGNQPAPQEDDIPINPRLAFLGASKLGSIMGRDTRRHEVEHKPQAQMRMVRPAQPQDPNRVIQQIVDNRVKQIVRQVPQRIAPAQPQAPARSSFASYRFKKKEKPVVQFHDVKITDTNLSSSIPKKKPRRRK